MSGAQSCYSRLPGRRWFSVAARGSETVSVRKGTRAEPRLGSALSSDSVAPVRDVIHMRRPPLQAGLRFRARVSSVRRLPN